MRYTTTKTIEITLDGGLITITSLLNEDTTPNKNHTWISFYSDGQQSNFVDMWDNTSYLEKTYKQLKRKKYNGDVKAVAETLKIKKKHFRKQYMLLIEEAKNLKML